jgi:predicted PurR-regulated permease PerM
MPNARLQATVYGSVLALIIGWVLYIGKDIFVPIVFAILVVYVVAGLTRQMQKLPLVGRLLPIHVHHALSILVIAIGLGLVLDLIVANRDSVVALAPRYQDSLLVAIQKVAVFLRIETEPTWTTLRQDVFARISLHALLGSMVASASSILVTIFAVALYASFLLIEQRSFAAKIANLSEDPRTVARIGQVTSDINARIGSYLALKTLISILLGAASWLAMALVGLEFAAFWAILIAVLNYIPYIGSFLGVLLPTTMAVVQFGHLNEVLALLLPLALIQFAIGNFLDPYLMGNSLNLSPFVILVSLAVWSGLWGIPGALLAVPITAMLAIVFSEIRGTRPIAILLSRNGRL